METSAMEANDSFITERWPGTDNVKDVLKHSVGNFKTYQHGIIFFNGAETIECCIGSHYIALSQGIDSAVFSFYNPDDISYIIGSRDSQPTAWQDCRVARLPTCAVIRANSLFYPFLIASRFPAATRYLFYLLSPSFLFISCLFSPFLSSPVGFSSRKGGLPRWIPSL